MKHVLIGKEVIIAPAALKAHRLILYKGNALLVNIAALFLLLLLDLALALESWFSR